MKWPARENRRVSDIGPPPGTEEQRGRSVTLDPSQLSKMVRVRWLQIVAVAALSGILAGAALWIVTGKQVEGVVRSDVKAASVFNCSRTNRSASAGQAVRAFLESDATLNRELGEFDSKTAQANRDLSREIQKLGNQIPPGIAVAYNRVAHLYQDVAVLRIRAARLWAGAPRASTNIGQKPRKSLSAQVLFVAQVPCDRVILP